MYSRDAGRAWSSRKPNLMEGRLSGSEFFNRILPAETDRPCRLTTPPS